MNSAISLTAMCVEIIHNLTQYSNLLSNMYISLVII